jgi:hypothetical protein
MSGLITDVTNSLTGAISTETATGLVGLVGSLVGIGGFPTTSQYEGLQDPAPNWMWTADITSVPGLVQLENIYIKDINFGYNSITAEQRYRNGIYQNFPKGMQSLNTNLIFYEPQTYSISYYLEQWRQQIRDKVGNWYTPSNYMGCIIIRLYDTTGLQQMQVQLDGVWPTHQQQVDLNYSHSDMVMTAAEFAVNGTTITYIGEGFSTLLSGGLTTGLLAAGGTALSSVTKNLVQLI